MYRSAYIGTYVVARTDVRAEVYHPVEKRHAVVLHCVHEGCHARLLRRIVVIFQLIFVLI